MRLQRFFYPCLIATIAITQLAEAQQVTGFTTVEPFSERVRWERLPSGIKVMLNLPADSKPGRQTLVIYATPNGNTIEQTFGSTPLPGQDFRFDIQHVAAQIRCCRGLKPDENLLLAIVQAPKLSWPGFCSERRDAGTLIRQLVTSLTTEFKADQVVLAGHSGGGSFLFEYIAADATIPSTIGRMVFLDANYSYSDNKHGDKLLDWLRGDPTRQLIVVAYDDREITLNGKKVVGADGGTLRATKRMTSRFAQSIELTDGTNGPFQTTHGLSGQFQVFLHPNPENKILHTALVGEMNGVLQGLTAGTSDETRWGKFGGPRAYSKWIQQQPLKEPVVPLAVIVEEPVAQVMAIPARHENAPAGRQFRDQILAMPRQAREAAIVKEITEGNIPAFVRQLVTIRISWTDPTGTRHVADYRVMPDYLAVGTDEDFFRVPMTPQSALAIAEKCNASLITTKVSDDLYSAAPNRLAPRPLTKDRDAVQTFFQHHELIELQLQGKKRALTAGIKKDVVLSNRLREKPHRVAIYGWHQTDAIPIQPLYVGHVDWYVDYSHGVRLMSNQMVVDGEMMTVSDVLEHPVLNGLLSNEGPINTLEIRRVSQW